MKTRSIPMRRRLEWIVSGAAALALGACAAPDATPTGPRVEVSEPSLVMELAVPGQGNAGESPAHVHLIHGVTNAARPGGGGGNPNLTYHGGPIMTSAAVTAIYWGTSWNDSRHSGELTGLATFYGGLGNSNYMGTNTEYTNGSGGHVGKAVSYSGASLDLSAAPRRAPRTSEVLAEVCSRISNPVPNGYYPVYTDLPRGHNGYCAWHSYGSCNGTPVQIAFFFDLDGDPGCDPGAPYYTHAPGLAALANVSGHEISEAVTDPQLNAWYDASGAENADKCAWTFSGKAITFGSVSWKIQGNWSNDAYTNHTGYDSKGCIDGA
jgi:hypothetical protein